jgi:uncharacterized integral membrane protein
MIGLVINVLLLLMLAVFVALNVPYSTSVNLFGYIVEQISSVAVILVSFVFGVLFSFFFYLAETMRRSRRLKQKKKSKELKEREKELGEHVQSQEQSQEQGKSTLQIAEPKKKKRWKKG